MEMTASILDNPKRHRDLDAGLMHDAIAAFPDHLEKSLRLPGEIDWSAQKPTTPQGVCICGMGGSAIGGDLARSYWEAESPIPIVVVRNHRLPAFINDHWFVIASSYSGNTEEVLAAVAEAARRGCRRILALASGGRLAALAQEHRWPLIRLPNGLMPRAALGYSFGGVMLAMAHWGVAGNNPSVLLSALTSELLATSSFLAGRVSLLDRACPLERNPAKQAATNVAGRIVAILGTSGTTDVIAARIKTQLCENSKALAFANAFPEVTHNEIVGLAAFGNASEQLAVIILSSEEDHPAAVAQQEAFQRMMRDFQIPLIRLQAEGHGRLDRMLSLVQTGDFISYHLAILNGQDPTPIAAIDTLKRSLVR
jgi:glucose/mannose-6-phosphate isomerase